MNWLAWSKQLFTDLRDAFRQPPPTPPERPRPARPTVPPAPDYWVRRHEEIDADLYFDVVVDFGTSATVIAAVEQAPAARIVRCLVGQTEFSSRVAIKRPEREGALPQVMGVGPDALAAVNNDATRSTHLYHSLKRYVELLSRQDSAARDLSTQTFIVGEYIKKALEMSSKGEIHHRLRRKSHIVLSVPNNFNGAAVNAVKQGVRMAFVSLVGEEHVPLLEDMQVVREGEAAAYCFWRTLRGDRIEVDKRSITRDSWSAIRGDVPRAEDIRRFAVLDVGAGTTDLTVVDVVDPGPESRRLRVWLNAGVPIGGVDIDYRLLSAIMKKPSQMNIYSREMVLEVVSERKKARGTGIDSPGTGFFAQHEWTVFIERLRNLVETDSVPPSHEDAGAIALPALDVLIRLSVSGLLGLISNALSRQRGRPLDAVVLTGRGSMLQEVRARVIDWAEALNVPVVTLGEGLGYELKRVVAFGCALVPVSRVKASMPTGTLGRELRVEQGRDMPASGELNSDTPVTAEIPQVWQIVTPRPVEPVRWWLTEGRVVRGGDLDRVDYDTLGVLGLVRLGAMWPSGTRGGNAEQFDTVRIVRDPASDVFFSRSADGWKPIAGFEARRRRGENPLTGVPFTFGDEAIFAGDGTDAAQ